jgi:CRISPR-associated protein Cmr3
MADSTYRIRALDTWFFRESRPMEAIGGSELSSVFPPPPRTVLGALRTAIGNHEKVDWQSFSKSKSHSLCNFIGHGNDLGPLKLKGLWLCYNDERLYPVPAYLLGKTTKPKQQDYQRLCIGDVAIRSHIGTVRLPYLPKQFEDYKALNNIWVTQTGMGALLQGNTPESDQVIGAEKLFDEETRLGIARDYAKKAVEDGALYQTKHLRPKPELTLEIDLQHADDSPKLNGWVRLGGEGRLAHVEHCAASNRLLQKPNPDANTKGLIIHLLSPAHFTDNNKSTWVPAGFKSQPNGTWRGEINGIELILHSAVLGKTQREGGWDMAEHKPRPVHSLVPAGSAYYCTLVGETNKETLAHTIEQLHGAQMGEEAKLGRGLIVCGLWQTNEGAPA